MECHQTIFVEPMPGYDVQKQMNWAEITAIIQKAADKEKNFTENPELNPDQRYHIPFERMKNVIDSCKYLLEDMQVENILDIYELRQDKSKEEKHKRTAV